MAWDVIKCLPMLLIAINYSHGTAGRQHLYFYMGILIVSVFRIVSFSFIFFTLEIRSLLHSCRILSVRVCVEDGIFLLLNVEMCSGDCANCT